LLTIVGEPLAFAFYHIRKDCLEGGILRAAGVDPELDFCNSLMHVADAHLPEPNAVFGAFDAEIVFTAAEAVPHGLDICTDLCSGPVRVTHVCDHAAQMLESFVLVLDGCLEPVFAIKVNHHSALVKTTLAVKLRFYGKGKELVCSADLQDRGVIISEMIVGPLPKIRVGRRDDFDSVVVDFKFGRLAGPFPEIHADSHFKPLDECELLLDDFAKSLCQLVCTGGGLAVAGVAFQDVGDFLHVLAFAELADGLQVAVAATQKLQVVHLAVFVIESDELCAGATGSEFLSLHKILSWRLESRRMCL